MPKALLLTTAQNIKAQGPYSQYFIFFITYVWTYKLGCYITLGWKDLSADKRSSLLAPFVSYKDNEVQTLEPRNFYWHIQALQLRLAQKRILVACKQFLRYCGYSSFLWSGRVHTYLILRLLFSYNHLKVRLLFEALFSVKVHILHLQQITQRYISKL